MFESIDTAQRRIWSTIAKSRENGCELVTS